LASATARHENNGVRNDVVTRQVRDLQLAMAELHDQFRDEETVELRELQRELEATAKACRIAQFKLRKADRRCDQLEAERAQAEERVRCLENCLQGSVLRCLSAVFTYKLSSLWIINVVNFYAATSGYMNALKKLCNI